VKNITVCTIGGGSGMPVINQALVLSGFSNIRSIVTTFDSGGDTGRIRTDERGQVLAFSDYWRSLLSLWKDDPQKKVWHEMLLYRDGRGRNFGNSFFQFMTEKAGNLSGVDNFFIKLTKAKLVGKVIPVSLSPANLCFQTKSGKTYIGEHHLDFLRLSFDKVDKIWLKPQVKANKEAVRALKEAQLIIVCPGSMYGSILVNFLPLGMKKAYQKAKAKKILLTNIMSVANENHGFSQNDYLNIFSSFLELDKPFDLILMARLDVWAENKVKKVLANYKLEHSWPIKNVNNCRVKTQVEDIVLIDKENWRFRHASLKLKKVFQGLL